MPFAVDIGSLARVSHDAYINFCHLNWDRLTRAVVVGPNMQIGARWND